MYSDGGNDGKADRKTQKIMWPISLSGSDVNKRRMDSVEQ